MVKFSTLINNNGKISNPNTKAFLAADKMLHSKNKPKTQIKNTNQILAKAHPVIFRQFAIQPLNNPSCALNKDELTEYQALKHFFTLKDDNGRYLGLPVELVLQTKDEIENSYREKCKDKILPDIKKGCEIPTASMSYNFLSGIIDYKDLPAKQTLNGVKLQILYLKDEELINKANKIVNSANNEDIALFSNCCDYYLLAHEYKHFDQFSLVAKAFGPMSHVCVAELKAYKKTKDKKINSFFIKYENEIDKQFKALFPQEHGTFTNTQKMQKLEDKAKELDEKYKSVFIGNNSEKGQNEYALIDNENIRPDIFDDYENVFYNIGIQNSGISNKEYLSIIQNDKEFIEPEKKVYAALMKNMFSCNLTNAQIKQNLKDSGKSDKEFKKYLALKFLLNFYNDALLQDKNAELLIKDMFTQTDSEDYKKLYEKLDNAKDDNARLEIIKNAIETKTISLTEEEQNSLNFYTKIYDENQGKEITDEEKIKAKKYLDAEMNYTSDAFELYYNNPLEQEAYSCQYQKAIELFYKIKQSDKELGLKTVGTFEEDIQKKIEEKNKKIEENSQEEFEQKKSIYSIITPEKPVEKIDKQAKKKTLEALDIKRLKDVVKIDEKLKEVDFSKFQKINSHANLKLKAFLDKFKKEDASLN